MTAGGVKEARRPVRAGAAGARGLLRAARTRRGSEGPQVTVPRSGGRRAGCWEGLAEEGTGMGDKRSIHNLCCYLRSLRGLLGLLHREWTPRIKNYLWYS